MHKRAWPILCLTLIGCASPPTAEEERRYLSSVPTCSGEKDCEIKWARARSWMLSELSVKLHHYTPDFMETFDPEDAGVGARVVKEPVDQTRYRIVLETWCVSLGCFRSPTKIKQSFNDYVNGDGGAAALQSELSKEGR